jgi:aryl-alcohol dehydrogenase-like predicted oxidoreductase
MNSIRSKLVLGSANFGLDYGLANNSGKLSDQDLNQIINTAKLSGINTIDTAQTYGDCEMRLGALKKLNFEIITKIGVGLEKSYHQDKVCKLVNESLDRLNLKSVFSVMLHRPEILLGLNGSKVISELISLKEKGVIKKIGVSIYSPEILGQILKLIDIDIVQAPFNIFDQRILSSDWAFRLKENDIEIHTRSVFLQGLLLMKRENLHQWFEMNFHKLFDNWYEYQERVGVSADEITLGFALHQPWVDKVVVGVDNAHQLDRLLHIERNKRYTSDPYLVSNNLDLIDPSRWQVK